MIYYGGDLANKNRYFMESDLKDEKVVIWYNGGHYRISVFFILLYVCRNKSMGL